MMKINGGTYLQQKRKINIIAYYFNTDVRKIFWKYLKYLWENRGKYDGCSKSNENVRLVWAYGVQSSNTVQWYIIHSCGYQKYKFQLNRIKTGISVIIRVKHIRVLHLFFTFKKMQENLEQQYAIKFWVKLRKTAKERKDMLQQTYGDSPMSMPMFYHWYNECRWWIAGRVA